MTPSSPPRLPVTLLTGFLGAGKTTLLNRLLRAESGLRLAVMVNDFGAVNIDVRLVDTLQSNQDTISLTNGCMCCSMRGDLVSSTLRVLAQPNPPEHLIVEASGIADPVAAANVFRSLRLRDRTRLDGIVTLVDAEHARDPHLDGQLIQDQIRSADLVVLNKIDLVELAARRDLHGWIRSLVPGARIVETVNADVPVELVLGIDADQHSGILDERTQGRHAAFQSWVYRTRHPLAYRRVRAALSALPADVFRAKGVLALADAPNLLFVAQVVGRRVAIEPAGPWGERIAETELVCIGSVGALTMAGLSARLDACETDSVVLMERDNFQRLRLSIRPAPDAVPIH